LSVPLSLRYVDVILTNPLDGAAESLSYTPYTATAHLSNSLTTTIVIDPKAVYESGLGRLRISGLATTDDYQKILRTIKYNNVAIEPLADDRIITFVAFDGELNSIVQNATVHMFNLNNPPHIDMDAPVQSPVIPEEVPLSANAGVSIAELVSGGMLTDPDREAVFGVAVIGVDETHGQWQYKIADGNDWQPVDGSWTSVANALLLNASTTSMLRFLPNFNFDGTAGVTFVAWDQTDGRRDGDR